MAISTSTLLAIIGNKYVVGNELPKLQYRTLCDQYVDFCFTLQIITIGSFLLVYYWSSHEMDGVGNLGALFNEVAFSFQLYATVAFHYWLAWRLKVHSADMNMWIEILKPEESRVQNNQRESRPEIPGCSFTSISYNHRLDLVRGYRYF